MQKISATIITYNEAHDIQACLESVKWVDEIIVVDSGSTDATLEFCKKYNARIVVNPWPGYVNQKNFSLKLASNEWVIALDADERLSVELNSQIKALLKNNLFKNDGYFMPRRTYYFGRWINHCGWYPDYKLRLFRKSKGIWQGDDPHDFVSINGTTGYLRGDILHYPYKDIDEHLKKISLYTSIMAEIAYSKGFKFKIGKLIFSPVAKFFRMYLLRFGFLDGLQGFVIALMGAYYIFLRHLKLWEIYRSKNAQAI